MAIAKSAETHYPLHDFLRDRWSPIAFSDRAVEREKLGSLLEAARWAASCFNEQPWSFIVATKENPTEYDRLLSCLVEANQDWAKTAPVLMLSVAKLQFARNGQDNAHAWHDVGLAVGNLTVQASALGLFVHQMAGFDPDKARELYKIPAGQAPIAALAIGYLGSADTLSEALQQRHNAPRSRKPLSEFVYSGTWGNPHGWV